MGAEYHDTEILQKELRYAMGGSSRCNGPYANTRMLQTVLVEPKWAGRMTPEDYRGLTPLIYGHVNPYGRFDLDLNSRIDFGRLAA